MVEISTLEAATKPSNTLLRAAVGKALRHYVTLTAFLNSVITDLRGCIQTLLDVSLLENLPIAIGRAGPDSGKAVGLKFHPH